MLPEEHATFEEQLATDLASQEALSQIVLIHKSLQISVSATPSPGVQTKHTANRPDRSSRVVALLTTSLALLFIVWIGIVKQEPTLVSQPVSENTSDQQSPVDVADETHTTLASMDIDVPDWMLVAVEASDFEDEMEIMDFDDDEETL